MTEFKVGDRVRLKDSERSYAENHGLLGTLAIKELKEFSAGTIAYFEGVPTHKGTFTDRLEHVPPAVTIDPARTYRTRDGREVRIYATDGSSGLAVHGAVKKEGEWILRCWTESGRYYEGEDSRHDLIEVKPERTQWLAWRRSGTHDYFMTYDHKPTRKECPNIVATVSVAIREGDGLEGGK